MNKMNNLFTLQDARVGHLHVTVLQAQKSNSFSVSTGFYPLSKLCELN